MAFPIALQLYSVREDMKNDFKGTLKKVKELGYDGVEFAGLFDLDGATVKAYCEEVGLIPISAHVPLKEMLEDLEGTLNTYKEIGVKYIAVPYVDADRRPGTEGWLPTIEAVAKIGAAAKEKGLTLLYHNHDFEFTKVDGEYGLDMLYRMVSPEYLQTELDTCWVNIGGEIPAQYIAKYSGRTPVVHLKDFNLTGKLPAHLYALIGIDEGEVKDDEPSSFEFRPVGHGMQDMPSILEAAVASGAQWVVVEQDEPSMGLSRMDSIKTSREYLKSLGW